MCLSIGIMYELVADNALGFKGRMAELGFGGTGMQVLPLEAQRSYNLMGRDESAYEIAYVLDEV